jgi:hypothetical protein
MASPSALKASSTFPWNSCCPFDAVTVVVLDETDEELLSPSSLAFTNAIRPTATSSGATTAAATLRPWLSDGRAA